MQKSNLQRVIEWHKNCGKNVQPVGSKAYWKSIDNQLERIAEELKEVQVEVRNRDLSKLISEICDLEFVVQGLAMMVQHDHQEAMNRIFASNDRKYTKYQVVAEDVAKHYAEKGVACRIVESNGHFSVHRIHDDKIMKFPDHVNADLTDLTPKPDTPYSVYLVWRDKCGLCSASEEALDASGIEYEKLTPETSKADLDFCKTLNVCTYGSIIFVDEHGVESVLCPKNMTPLSPSEVFEFLTEHTGI